MHTCAYVCVGVSECALEFLPVHVCAHMQLILCMRAHAGVCLCKHSNLCWSGGVVGDSVRGAGVYAHVCVHHDCVMCEYSCTISHT